MVFSRIHKLYLSNFLTGLVFWYGIEKLFMAGIGIDAVGVGIATAAMLAFNLVFDIPSGIIADRWSRKGVLVISAVALAVCSILLGASTGLPLYLLGYMFYGLYVVATSGTYQAIIYDTLHEEGRSADYSRVMGRAYALFLAGAGVANVASGFIAHGTNYQMTFWLTIISCVLNAALLLTVREPTFHKAEQKERMLHQLSAVTKAIFSMKVLRILAIIMSALAVVELFKGEFGQLYMLRYVTEVQIIGLLWAAYAFTWSLGSLIAHRFHGKLDVLVWASTLPLIWMAFIDNWLSLILFMVQAVASAALLNQIETRIQDTTPSSVRASVLSVLSAAGRAISIPASFALGWLFRDYGPLAALWLVAGVASFVLLYWHWNRQSTSVATRI